MKVVILAGGFGTRISEETESKPKPMVKIGSKPIIWHIMKLYASYGFDEFIILLGYKGYIIKEYFSNYYLHQSNVTFNLKNNDIKIHSNECESWKVTLLDTGLNTMTGGRIKRAEQFIGTEPFLLTYGDGVSDVNILNSIEFHEKNKKLVTVTAVQPASRFGSLRIGKNNFVSDFREKPKENETWINGGYFVCDPKIFKYIDDDSTVLEEEPLAKLSSENQMVAWQHKGFWSCMDTIRDKNYLNKLWNENKAPWKIW